MERLSADTVGEWYNRRRDQHRVVETNRGAVEKQQSLVEQLDAKVTGEVRSTDVILADMEQATATQKAYDSAKAGVAELEREQDSLNEKWGQVLKEKESLGNEIVKLEALLATAYEKMEVVNARIEKGTQVRADLEKELAETRSLFAPMKDQTEIMRKLRQELQAVQGQQKQIIEQEQSQKRLVDLQAEYDASKQTHAKLDKQLEDLRLLRKQLLEGIDLGVEGLEVGQGELRLHGVTFKQASLAQKLRVSCAVAMKGNGALKLLRIDNGEHLDSESRGYLLKLADEQGWQVIMTCVADQAELGVEIIDKEIEPTEQVKTARRAAKGKLFEDRHTAVEAGM
jgi:ribosome-binding factor A